MSEYNHTHISRGDDSPAMLVEDLDDVIVLENENGDRWVDRADDWKKLNP